MYRWSRESGKQQWVPNIDVIWQRPDSNTQPALYTIAFETRSKVSTFGRKRITINVFIVFYGVDIMISMRATSIKRAVGRGAGPENRYFFGP
jgi:hypothetical protein